MSKLAAILFLLTQSVSSLFSQGHTGAPFITNFGSKEYQAEVRNWSLVQGNDGLLYVGNNGGLLIFDGNNWQQVPVNETIVRSLAKDQFGQIYIGAQGDFGKLESDATNRPVFKSFLPLLAPEHRHFSDVWGIHELGNRIIFNTVSALYVFRGEEYKIIESNSLFHRSYVVNGIYYVQDRESGLHYLHGDSLVPVPQGDFFAGDRIYAMLPLTGNQLLIASFNQGLLIYDRSATDRAAVITPFPTQAADFFKQNNVYQAVKSKTGNYAFATTTAGVVILNQHGQLQVIIDETTGLTNNIVFNLMYDQDENLILALGNGISIVEINSPIRLWHKGHGLKGMVYSSLQFEGDLYSGTAEGLFVKKEGSENFEKIQGVGTQCWRLMEYNSQGTKSILAATTFGLFEIVNGNARLVEVGSSLQMVRSPFNDQQVFISKGVNSGTSLMLIEKQQGKWLKNSWKLIDNASFWSLCFDTDQHLWMGSEIHGLVKIDKSVVSTLNLQNQNDEITQLTDFSIYTQEQGLPSLHKTYLFLIENQIWAATKKGIFRYQSDSNKFEPLESVNSLFKETPWIYQLKYDTSGFVWFDSNLGKGVLIRQMNNNAWNLYDIPLKRIPAQPEYSSHSSEIKRDQAGIIYYGTPEGLVSFDYHYQRQYISKLNPLIRSVAVNDSIIYHGNGKSGNLVLNHRQNKLMISFAWPYFEGLAYNQYSFKLNGFDQEWSEWNKRAEKEYTNLPPGNYQFQLKARNIFLHQSEISTISFDIKTPWYQLPWMYVIYTIASMSLIWLLIVFNTNRLKKEKVNLENTVHERTEKILTQNEELIMYQEEIKAQRDQLEEQNKRLEHNQQLIIRQKEELESAVEMRTKELAESNEELKNQYLQLEQFSFISAHNLRGPVASILGLASIFNHVQAVPENQEILSKILAATQDLDHVIHDLGEILNVQKGKQAKIDSIKLDPFFQNIINRYLSDIEKYNITIHVNNSVDYVNLIPAYFDSIVSNLVSNAIKYRTHKREASIYLICKKKGKEVHLTVQDNGQGFDSEKMADKLFKPFQRFHTNKDGRGLGMYLVKTQVEAMEGSIRLYSEPDVGTRIDISFPQD